VNEQLGLIDPVLLAQLAATDSQATTGSGQNLPPIALPANTPLDTVLLAYERRTLIDRIAATRQAYADSSTQSIVPQDFASIVERDAPLQIIPALPSPLIPIVVAAALGILLAIGIPVLMDFLDHSIRDPRTAGNALSARVLSTIPPTSPSTLAALARPGSARDAAYRALAATSVSTDELPRAIVVTSPVGDMQDSVAANFAAALAGLGLRVALIATEARQAWFLGADRAPNAATLPDLLALARSGSLNGQISDALVPTQLANLAVLAPGATEADDLLDGLPALLEALARSGIDVTVIAAPALLEDPAATILAWSTRSVLWVIEAGEVTEPEAREAASRLALAGATPFGVAMVDAKG
jgi:Mrp family chromosome partitioning ATPase